MKFRFQIISLVVLLLSSFAQGYERKAVYDLTTGDAKKIESRLFGGIKYIAEYYRKQNIEFKAVIAISGESYKYFVEDIANSPYKGDKQLIEAQKRLKPLMQELVEKYGVRFDMCGMGMKGRKIKAESLYSFIHHDKIKPVYMIEWQNKGYAYMPMK
jgi:uncharacterized protein